MATATLRNEGLTFRDEGETARCLASFGIGYERWQPTHALPDGARPEEVLAAYAPEIERLKASGGYVTADIIDVGPQTAGLEVMLAKFKREHWHDEDEVRFILEGHGVFHIHSVSGGVVAIEVEPGDLISVPRGTWHWFDLCADRRIRAIRLFKDPAGWAPCYTESAIEERYEPVCLGPAYLPPRRL